jgi:hypothetical protein
MTNRIAVVMFSLFSVFDTAANAIGPTPSMPGPNAPKPGPTTVAPDPPVDKGVPACAFRRFCSSREVIGTGTSGRVFISGESRPIGVASPWPTARPAQLAKPRVAKHARQS